MRRGERCAILFCDVKGMSTEDIYEVKRLRGIKFPEKKKKIPLARATIPRFTASILFPIVYPVLHLLKQADTSGEPFCLLHVDSLSVSRTPVGYCARNHRRETVRECTSPMRGRTHAPHGSGRTLWNGMRGRRVGAWAAAGRTHVWKPERDSPVYLSPMVCHETEFERGTRGGKKTKRKTRGREKERKGEGTNVE